MATATNYQREITKKSISYGANSVRFQKLNGGHFRVILEKNKVTVHVTVPATPGKGRALENIFGNIKRVLRSIDPIINRN